MPNRESDSTPKRLDSLIRGAAAHPHDDGASEDGIGQVAQPGQCHGAVGRVLDGFDGLAAHDTAACDGALTVARIEQATHVLVLPRLGAEDGVDLIEENRRSASVVVYLA